MDSEKNPKEGCCIPTVHDFAQCRLSNPRRSNIHVRREATKSCCKYDSRIGGNFRCFEGRNACCELVVKLAAPYGLESVLCKCFPSSLVRLDDVCLALPNQCDELCTEFQTYETL